MLYSSSGECILPEPILRYEPDNPNSTLKAVIVDQLSLTAPNETFIQTAAAILTKANYTVDYYNGEKVNVNFYRCLATGGHSLVILRIHSALSMKEGSETVAFFTSEPYSKNQDIWEQLNDEVGMVRYFEGSPEYMGISPDFVRNRVSWKFNNTIIMMMGCYGLTFTKMAEAFTEKGAKAYINWNWTVSSNHTDQVTTHILDSLVVKKQTIKQAVAETMKEIGHDFDDEHNCTFALFAYP